ncbi:MAG: type III-A CRISPR-associated RAMP protein Csm5 [Aggregatilineales bacterium]
MPAMKPIQQTQRHFNMRLQTLTPLHIGTGEELMRDLDFLVERGATYRLDIERILIDQWDRKAIRNPADILRTIPQDQWANYVRYEAKGVPSAQTSGSKLRECMKTHDDLPIIPGSSLKGALRTALAWAGWAERGPKTLHQDDIGRSPKFAAQGLEHQLFSNPPENRNFPNYDLLRALHVGDCRATRPPKNTGYYDILNVRVAKMREFASPIEIEAVATGAQFRGRLSIDKYLFTRPELHFDDRRAWLTELSSRVNDHSRDMIDKLLPRFQEMAKLHDGLKGAARIVEFYAGLRQFITELPAHQCILCLGWGGGWDSKTFGSRLQADPAMFERIVERFKLSRGKAPRKPGDPFPRTRRVAVQERNRVASLAEVMGWVRIDLNEQPMRAAWQG